MKVIIKNIAELVQVEGNIQEKVSGAAMKNLGTLKDAFLCMEDGLITDFGTMDSWAGIDDWNNTEVVDAEGGMVFPSWVDSHSHLVFGGTREGEFVDRINGLTYEEIANRGGGILNSAAKLAEASEDELFESASTRLIELIKMGTGALEIKSGYGLSTESELKMLRVVKRLKENFPITIKATFLGAHALPLAYKNDKEGYLKLIEEEMLPLVAKENLAEYVDIFCEKGYFSVADMERVVTAGKKHGLIPKVHVNQFNIIGGIPSAVKLDALSVDHLEVVNQEDIDALKGSSTMPTMLPSCSFFLKIPYGPARNMIDQGLPICLATDYNPGSTPSGNMNFVVSLACIHMNMNPEEAINAATINGAYAMGISKTEGSIAKGKKGNIFITKKIPSYSFIPYNFGHNCIDRVFINGCEFNR
ncbi:MAG: imidazolonepropionase [Flavobacteriales bacterium]|jgi:imidazolonepropionase|tara:strand:- start:1027 stop:2277 length:1251 start_codon:yes stop_codon:yes gene_type:complete